MGGRGEMEREVGEGVPAVKIEGCQGVDQVTGLAVGDTNCLWN